MALYHKIRLYKRAAVWVFLGIMVASAVVFANMSEPRQSVLTYINPPKVLAVDSGGISNPGTGLPAQPAEPQECINDEQQNSQNQQTDSDTQRQTNQQQHDALDQQLQALSTRMSDQSLTDADRQSIQSQMDSIRSQMQTLEQQASQSNGQPQDSQQNTGSHEPSVACKAAIVSSAKSNLGQFKEIINTRTIPILDRVDNIANTVESSIPHFREIGVPEATITKLQADIAIMRSSNTTLRGFFANIISQINIFLARISDPNAAFDGMKNGFSVGDQNAAAKAGDDLVTAFTDLQTIINGIKE